MAIICNGGSDFQGKFGAVLVTLLAPQAANR